MTSYFKLSGSGNDFIPHVEPPTGPTDAEIRAWCSRGVSVGADGLFVLRSTAKGARMHYFNADGAAAGLCLNGTRCAAQLAFELGWAEDDVEIKTDVGAVRAHRKSDTTIALRFSQKVAEPQLRTVDTSSGSIQGWVVNVGVPHFVVPQNESVRRTPVTRVGAELRRHPSFGDEGTNVDFVYYFDPSVLELRTYERGVEAETLACGTGVLAAAAVGLSLETASLPITARTKGGFELVADRISVSESQETWELAGDARLLTAGSLKSAASVTPQRPDWIDP